MSPGTRHRLLLRTFPRTWRERYGDELDALIVEADGDRRMRVRTALDVVRAGARERLDAAGLAGDQLPAAQRARARLLLVLCSWSLFVVAGVSVQKASEHWQGALRASERGLPAGAFHSLEVAAAIGSALVLLGIVLALPRLLARVRSRQTDGLRRPLLRALVVSAVALIATAPVLIWADRLTPPQRNGHDLPYEIAVICWALLSVLALAAWTAAAVAAARQAPLHGRLLRAEIAIATALTAAMLAMLAATVIWWLALVSAAPGFVDVPRMLVPVLMMLVATGLAALGTAGAIHAARSDDGAGRPHAADG